MPGHRFRKQRLAVAMPTEQPHPEVGYQGGPTAPRHTMTSQSTSKQTKSCLKIRVNQGDSFGFWVVFYLTLRFSFYH